MIKINLVNQSTVFSDNDLPALANALQIQVSRDFFPIWGVNAQIYYTPSGKHATSGYWVLALLDNSDQADALAYHDVTPDGQPLGKIFVKTTLANNSLVSVSASHELVEMLCDPDVNLTAELDDASGIPSRFVSYEPADPCQDDSFAYPAEIPPGWPGAGTLVKVTDFVFPSWFESFRTPNIQGPTATGFTQFDFQKKITAPFQLLPGGYIGFLDLGNLAAGWQQEIAANTSIEARMAARPRPGSRRSRRALPRSQWIRSTYQPVTEPGIPAGAQL